jgi:SRSO17 transposase
MPASRDAKPTVQFVDDYCQHFAPLFPEVRSFESFKFLHLGMISELKRKSLPAIAKVVGLENSQSLHHFLTESPWSAQQLRQQRLLWTLKVINGRKIILLIDETGDCKKGKTTDYVKRQYIGNVGKQENGIVAVTAYALVEGMILPLCFEVYKPRERLKEGEEYATKPEIAARIIRQLKTMGFEIQLVLGDSLYGESKTNFVNVLDELKLSYILAIRSNHGMWLPEDQQVYHEPWQCFTRTFSNGTSETRYVQEIVFGKRRQKQYYLLTTDPKTLPENATSYVMVSAPEVTLQEIGDHYGFRTWVEYGLKQSKDVLGWADFRVTDYAQIEKWWELVMSAFLMVSLFAEAFCDECPEVHQEFEQHPWWDNQRGWKNLLNNLRLIIQPEIAWNQLKPWLSVFPNDALESSLADLIAQMNRLICPAVHQMQGEHEFSSA